MEHARLPLETTENEPAELAAGGPFLIVMRQGHPFAHPLRTDRPLVVGRSSECDVVVDRVNLSRRHFSVTAGSPVRVMDLGSANGTVANGLRIPSNQSVPLAPASFIEAGGVAFILNDRLTRRTQIVPATPVGRQVESTPTEVIVADAAMRRLYERLDLVAQSRLPILVTGETGVGKEVAAARVHARSARSREPYVTLNCASLPETLLESELFGHERGAFTGATNAKPGLIESADGGTLFLDEIGELPLGAQAKLLRVLENGQISRLGAVVPRMVDVRFVAATNRDLPELVSRGKFRRDLYFRINGVTIHVPPLRDRSDEIGRLVAHFVRLGADRMNRRAPLVSPQALSLLRAHSWPGNVRELRNVVDRALALSPTGALDIDHIVLDFVVTGMAPPQSPGPERLSLRVDPVDEQRRIEEALAAAGGYQNRAAKLLGISRQTLFKRLRAYAIDPRGRRVHAREPD